MHARSETAAHTKEKGCLLLFESCEGTLSNTTCLKRPTALRPPNTPDLEYLRAFALFALGTERLVFVSERSHQVRKRGRGRA